VEVRAIFTRDYKKCSNKEHFSKTFQIEKNEK